MILSRCVHCGAIFRSRMFNFEGGNFTHVVLAGNTENCPRCGARAQAMDGDFSILGDTIRVLAGSNFTRESYRRFHDLVESSKKGEIDDQELQAAATAIDPKLGQAIALVSSAKLPMLLVLLVMYLSHCSQNWEVKLDVNQFLDQIQGRGVIELSDDSIGKGQKSRNSNATSDGAAEKGAVAQPRDLPGGHAASPSLRGQSTENGYAVFSKGHPALIGLVPKPTPRPRR